MAVNIEFFLDEILCDVEIPFFYQGVKLDLKVVFFPLPNLRDEEETRPTCFIQEGLVKDAVVSFNVI